MSAHGLTPPPPVPAVPVAQTYVGSKVDPYMGALVDRAVGDHKRAAPANNSANTPDANREAATRSAQRATAAQAPPSWPVC